MIGGALLLNRRTENQQAQQVPTPNVSPGSTPEGHLANLPSPPASPSESPQVKPTRAEALVVLNDRGRTITVDKTGNVSGLDDVSGSTRNEIAKVLLTERIEPPATLKNLTDQEGALRGGTSAQAFKLISPVRTVVPSDHPTFKWEIVPQASAYRVYVNDASGKIAARSDELEPNRREWVAPQPLKRGEIYAWSVVATVNRKEIVSPGTSSPQVKFQVLSNSNLRQLNNLKKTRSHLALGVFCARVGMISEAKREFEQLMRLNPRSRITRNLLRNMLR